MKTILSLIKSKDYLGSKVGFTINSSDSYQTIFGGIISLALTSLYIYFLVIFSQGVIYKTDPVGYDQLKPNTGQDKGLDLNHTFLAGYQITDWYLKPINIDELFFTVFEFHDWQKDENGIWREEVTHLDTIPCDKVDFDRNGTYKIVGSENYIFKDFYCPNITQIKDNYVNGTFSVDNKVKYIEFKLSLYNFNKTESKNLTKVMEFFDKNEITIGVLYPKIEYFIENIDAPFKIKWNYHYNFLSNYNFLLEILFFQNNELSEDKGFLFDEITTQSYKAVKDIININNPRSKENLKEYKKNPNKKSRNRDENYYLMEIYYDPNKNFHSRKYLKLPDVFANVLGMMDFISFFVVFVISYYNKWRLDAYLCQRLLYIEDEEAKNFNDEDFKKFLEKIQKNKHDIKCFLNIDNYKKSNLIKKDSEEISKEKSIGKDSYENKSSKELRNFSNFELEKITDKRKFEYQSNFNFKNKNDNCENNINDIEESRKIEISAMGFMQGNQDIKDINNINNINNNSDCPSDRKIFPEEEIGNYLDISFNKFRKLKNSLEFNLKNIIIYYCFPKRNIRLRKNYDIINSFSEKINEKFDIF